MKITMKEIAAQLNISIATVSKVINGKDVRISQETRSRVWEAVRSSGYMPNRVARSMVTKTTKTIGLIIPDISNPFFPQVACGVEDRAAESGYSVILCNTYEDMAREDDSVRALEEKMVDGIIYTCSSRRKTVGDAMKHLSVPIISLDRDVKGLKSQGKVVVNNILGARMATEHLIDRGYRKIIHITGSSSSIPAQLREEGYQRALKDAGMQAHILEGEYTGEHGYQTVMQLIKDKVSFDSLFCGNDLIAIGAIKALRECGKRIPDEVGVVGYDDIFISNMVDLGLTTIAQPKYQMGYHAASILIKMLSDEDVRTPVEVMDPKLVIRGTTR